MTIKKKETSPLLESLKEIGHFDIGWIKFPFFFKEGDISAEELECLGAVDFDKCEIHINCLIADPVLIHTLTHECWHVILSTLGIRAIDENCETELELNNEFITEQVTRGIGMFKRLNPELWSLIYENNYE